MVKQSVPGSLQHEIERYKLERYKLERDELERHELERHELERHELERYELVRYLAPAFYWLGFGFAVIPILPGRKVPAVKWDAWLVDLSPQKIVDHWTQHPDHEIGFIVGDGVIVLDADTREAVAALVELEKAFNVTPSLVVRTEKGEHHYFRLAAGTQAKAGSHSTKQYPERIDVKTGRSLVILPPSTGKSIRVRFDARNVAELVAAPQGFVDSVKRHNGWREASPPTPAATWPAGTVKLSKQPSCVVALLEHIDPGCGHDVWVRVLMAIFYEFEGSAEGLQVAIDWSSKGKNYKGRRDVEARWKSFKPNHPRPITSGFVKKLVADKGHDWIEICAKAETPFTRVDRKGEAE